ncbi:hypothetical protein [Aurantimonas endophytica]|uniref:Protein-L-isoaspartate O-methyltransferase n=1 Tax=Aurantimonas endophytica TaxID=1522175 RepID=A0A7W6HCY9_9HYPH|nr:hypothetical protein [Aurantimonas endophytica]MBB4002772.1 protein-L-isoaspartate O-methyltransferase [Aurantimonas endophytica]
MKFIATAVASGSKDQRLERVVEWVPREAFLGPGPWQVLVNRRYAATPSANPIYVCQNGLVALDATNRISTASRFCMPHGSAAPAR